MQSEEEIIQKLRKRYTQLAIASLFLLALLHGLHSFFFTLFFWPAVGFGLLAMYYYFTEKRFTQPHQQDWKQHPDQASSSGVNKRILAIIIGVAAISLLAVILPMISFGKKESNNTLQTEKSDEPQNQETEKTPADYDKALQEFNNQNYRTSISISRRAMIQYPHNNDYMLVLGDDYGALKQYDSAYVWFDKAYQNGARSAYLSHWLGFLHDDKGDLELALQFYKDALKQDSTRKEIYDRLAELEPDHADWYRKKSVQWKKK